MEYGGYGNKEVEEMGWSFPPLLDLDVGRHLVPKMRFLKYTLGGVRAATDDPTTTVVDAMPLSKLGRTMPRQEYLNSKLPKRSHMKNSVPCFVMALKTANIFTARILL